MEQLHDATKITMLFAAAMFLWALLLGTMKYRQILASPDHIAHPYTDIAHRAALLYSFALLLVAAFVQFGGWSFSVELAASSAMAAYFAMAVAGYTFHGWRKDTDNQFRRAGSSMRAFMATLITVEIGAWLVLVAGFVDGQFAH
ncbi:MAG TPA: hypothetical protein VE991_08705 [Acidimicrobiales bacterium]|nr:hypothetical protein [Acidimicrobiales bacterium]